MNKCNTLIVVLLCLLFTSCVTVPNHSTRSVPAYKSSNSVTYNSNRLSQTEITSEERVVYPTHRNESLCDKYTVVRSSSKKMCEEHYGLNNHNKVKECINTLLIQNGFSSYKSSYCN